MGGNPDVTNARRSCDDGKRFNIFKSNNLEHREVVETRPCRFTICVGRTRTEFLVRKKFDFAHGELEH